MLCFTSLAVLALSWKRPKNVRSPRCSHLVLTLESPVAVNDRRVAKCEQLSANRWHFELHVSSPADIDSDVEAWLRRAYEIST